jgi:acyl-coenzyme A thioesterase PaaI-like protein
LGTVALNVSYLAPTPIDVPVELRARITELTRKKAVVACTVFSGGKETARAEVIGVRVARPEQGQF